jgi:hypothetical protein
MTAYNVYDPRNYEGTPGTPDQVRQQAEIQQARFGYRPGVTGTVWDRYGEGMRGFSPEQVQYIQQQAAGVEPYSGTPPAPPFQSSYGQDWVNSLTSDYSNPLLNRRPTAVARPAFAGMFANPVGAPSGAPQQGGQTISLQPGAFSPMLRPQSAPHGNGGGNVNNPNNVKAQSTDPYQKMFAAMLQR